ncbi:MAG TPA: type II toxin-antitoxin system VapC family toxin [Roseiarcus sp.]
MGGSALTTLLLDTHVWAWSLTKDRRITDRALGELTKAQTILVSAISFFEIAQKVRLGKWPEMGPYVDRLSDLLEGQRGIATALEAADSLMAGAMEWSHRDPFDRLLAASAIRRGIAIVSADAVFDAVLARIW